MGSYIFVWKSQPIFSKGECAWPQGFGCNLISDCCSVMIHPCRVHCCVTCCYWVWVQSDDDLRPDAHRALRHCVIFESVFWLRNVGDTLSAICMILLLCGISRCFLYNPIYYFWSMHVHLFSTLGVVEHSQDRMPNKNAPVISWPLAMLIWVFVCL